jgi:type IV secretion system protein TrbL
VDGRAGSLVKTRLIALLLALVAVVGGLSAPAATADDGIIGQAVDLGCEATVGPVIGTIADTIAGDDLCDKVGDKTEKEVKKAWKEVWDSAFGDFLKSARDAGVWLLKTTLTVALLGPTLDLKNTGLFGREATLSGMLIWLGWIIALFGLMWQLGKSAVTGDMKHAGQAVSGWVQNALLSAAGLTVLGLMLKLGDQITAGLVNKTFDDAGGEAIGRIVAVMLPTGIANPAMLAGVLFILMLVGFIQLILVFLRQSAVPIQALLLPIAGAGRVGGDTTRKWAPKLITSILVVITYKPILAVIICTGFAEFAHSKTLADWLRGLATLVLATLAPAPLTKIFAPIGEEMGAGMSSGGMGGAMGAAANYLGGTMGESGDSGGGGSGGGSEPTSPVQRAQDVEQSMGKQGGGGGGSDGESGQDAVRQASRNGNSATAPAAQGDGLQGAVGQGTEAATKAGGAVGAATPVGMTVQVLDGVNDGIQKGAGEMGGGSE